MKRRLTGAKIDSTSRKIAQQYPEEVEFSKDLLQQQLGDILQRLGWRNRPPSEATLNRWLGHVNIDPAQGSFDRDELQALIALGGWYHSYHREGAAKYREYRCNKK